MSDSSDFFQRLQALNSAIAECIVTIENGETISIDEGLRRFLGLCSQIKQKNGLLGLVGNGGSAGIASHTATDFLNVAKIRSISFQEVSTLTCHANDYGYESVYSKSVEQFLGVNDGLIAISSSGKSQNILNASDQAIRNGSNLVTFSGFEVANPLRQLGHLNFWVNRMDYGLVELAHHFILHNITDQFIKQCR